MQKVFSLLQSPQLKLRAFVWLALISLVIQWGAMMLISSLAEDVVLAILDVKELPKLTRLVVALHKSPAWLVVLLPWFLFAVVSSLRPNLAMGNCVFYAASAMLAGVIILLVVMTGIFLPLRSLAQAIGTG